ncbi:hypothetical protein C5167_004285 [Papaver somniferum]|nr:hypothetical protein C5167_004285 [Papaver somniferum]
MIFLVTRRKYSWHNKFLPKFSSDSFLSHFSGCEFLLSFTTSTLQTTQQQYHHQRRRHLCHYTTITTTSLYGLSLLIIKIKNTKNDEENRAFSIKSNLLELFSNLSYIRRFKNVHSKYSNTDSIEKGGVISTQYLRAPDGSTHFLELTTQ